MRKTADPTAMHPAPTIGAGGALPHVEQARPAAISSDVADVAAIGHARALIEAELSEVVPDAVVCAAGVLVDELAVRLSSAGLLPLRVLTCRHEALISIEIRFACREPAVREVLDRLQPADRDWGLMLIDHFADAYGGDVDGSVGRLWCQLSTLW